MSSTMRRSHTAAFKAKVALAAAQRRSNHCAAFRAVRRSSQSDHVVEGATGAAADVFRARPAGFRRSPAVDAKSLHAKIGELTWQNVFSVSKAGLLRQHHVAVRTIWRSPDKRRL